MVALSLNWKAAVAAFLDALQGPTAVTKSAPPVVVATVGATSITGSEFEQGIIAMQDIWGAAKARGMNVQADMIAADDVATIIAELDPPLAPAIAVGKFLLPLLVAGYRSGAIVGEAPGPSYENSQNFKNR